MQADPALLCSPERKADLEVENGVTQMDYIIYLVVELGATEIRESHILELQNLAVQGVYPCAGNFRDARFNIKISNSKHEPPHASQVRSFVSDFIEYINTNPDNLCALECASYALWRLNWIHPFAGGNGRTARAIAYLILCMDLKGFLPGIPSFPARIYQEREKYVAALKAADMGELEKGKPNLDPMKEYLQEIVTQQLATAIDKLTRPSSI